MSNAEDQDRLRIPAFMRKGVLKRKSNKPLLLTALDRKRAGVKLEELRPKKVRKKVAMAGHRAMPIKISKQNIDTPAFLRQKIEISTERGVSSISKIVPRQRKVRSISKPARTFEAPILEAEIVDEKTQEKSKTIGTITQYFEKINVAVIELTGILSVGDCISYETADGRYEQVVDSMQIERAPVFTAKRGDDIGIKLQKRPVVGGEVVKI